MNVTRKYQALTTTAQIFSREWGILPCFECSLPISIHRVTVENHQMNIIQMFILF